MHDQKELENFADELAMSIREFTDKNNKRLIMYVSVIHIVSIFCIWFISKN